MVDDRKDDPLAAFRRRGEPLPERKPKEDLALRKYDAFGESRSGGLPRFLWLKTAPRRAEEAMPYSYLTNITTDTWGTVMLYFSLPDPVIVMIRGECLEPLIEALMNGSAAWIQKFESTWFIPPADGIAIVNDIELSYPGTSPIEIRH